MADGILYTRQHSELLSLQSLAVNCPYNFHTDLRFSLCINLFFSSEMSMKSSCQTDKKMSIQNWVLHRKMKIIILSVHLKKNWSYSRSTHLRKKRQIQLKKQNVTHYKSKAYISIWYLHWTNTKTTSRMKTRSLWSFLTTKSSSWKRRCKTAIAKLNCSCKSTKTKTRKATQSIESTQYCV